MQPLLRRAKRALVLSAGLIAGTRCPACGVRAFLEFQPVLWPELISEWELSAAWARHFDQREGCHCAFCRATMRDRQMARAILEFAAESHVKASSLNELVRNPAFQALRVAEINSAGMLHQFLAKRQNICYSQYGSTVPSVPTEDLMALSYDDLRFDLVITSETLEHVPDFGTALKEIYRVLKPGGAHVFSTPVVWDRPKTRKRASIAKGRVVHDLPPSYHGAPGAPRQDLLVFYEFGADIVDHCRAAGFEIYRLTDAHNPALVTFIARKAQK